MKSTKKARSEEKEALLEISDLKPAVVAEKKLEKEMFVTLLKDSLELSYMPKALANHAALMETIITTAWQDYEKICALYDTNHVVRIDHARPSVYNRPMQWGLLYQRPTGLDETKVIIGSRDVAGLLTDTHIQYGQLLEKTSEEEKSLIKTTINLSHFVLPLAQTELQAVIPRGTPLLVQIANSGFQQALQLIKLGADVNKYSMKEGNNPLLLAISKGWMHKDTDMSATQQKLFADIYPQQQIIKALLEQKADVNAPHLRNGMTPLHLACLRGDNPALVALLLEAGANLSAVDYAGRTVFDVMELSYEETQRVINQLTFSQDDEVAKKTHGFGKQKSPANKSWVATLPTEKDRQTNQEAIRKLLLEKTAKPPASSAHKSS